MRKSDAKAVFVHRTESGVAPRYTRDAVQNDGRSLTKRRRRNDCDRPHAARKEVPLTANAWPLIAIFPPQARGLSVHIKPTNKGPGRHAAVARLGVIR